MPLPPVTVFGCGPSGLVAAEAAHRLGYRVTILSAERRPSQLYGCQYLHAPIPGVTTLDEYVTVRYSLLGPVEDYRRKVYGPEYDGSTSPDDIEETHHAWDLRRTYQRLWARWEREVASIGQVDGNMAAGFMPDFLSGGGIVFNTMPRKALCRSPKHIFDAQMVWAMGDAPDQRIPVHPPEDNMVVCSGDPDVGWYRVSSVYGYGTVEWPWRDGRKPPFEGVAPVVKPLGTDCTCLPDVHYVGRYGRWQKGVLVHHVWEDVTKALTDVQGRLF